MIFAHSSVNNAVSPTDKKYKLRHNIIIEKLSLEKSDLCDNQCQGQQVDGYTALFKCFMIQYSQSIVLTAVNTILPAIFTKMIIEPERKCSSLSQRIRVGGQIRLVIQMLNFDLVALFIDNS